jgi:hypothetical protein
VNKFTYKPPSIALILGALFIINFGVAIIDSAVRPKTARCGDSPILRTGAGQTLEWRAKGIIIALFLIEYGPVKTQTLQIAAERQDYLTWKWRENPDAAPLNRWEVSVCFLESISARRAL